MSQPTGVFVPQDTNALFHFHFNNCNLLGRVAVYSDLNVFAASNHSRKVACFQMPFPFSDSFYQEVNYFADHCDTVIVLCSELHSRTVDFIRRNDRANIVYFICGALNFDMQRSPVHLWHDWFITTKHFYKHVKPDFLDQLAPYSEKERMFDILLGTQKPHRTAVYNYVKEHNLDDQVVMTYFNKPTLTQTFDVDDTSEWIWPDGYTADKDPNTNWTVTIVDFQGHRMSLSQIIPTQVYNRTAYTVVAETNTENDWVFFTEKIVKPILARRLFIVLGNRYYLQALRNLGFKTFDSIIDESYDVAEFSRPETAMSQLAWLCKQPQADVLAKIKPICDHNYDVMMNTDWYDKYFRSAFTQYF
jgi:hypothetical protein